MARPCPCWLWLWENPGAEASSARAATPAAIAGFFMVFAPFRARKQRPSRYYRFHVLRFAFCCIRRPECLSGCGSFSENPRLKKSAGTVRPFRPSPSSGFSVRRQKTESTTRQNCLRRTEKVSFIKREILLDEVLSFETPILYSRIPFLKAFSSLTFGFLHEASGAPGYLPDQMWTARLYRPQNRNGYRRILTTQDFKEQIDARDHESGCCT
jgi:hypothetical protein